MDDDLTSRVEEQDLRSDWQDLINKRRYRKLWRLIRALSAALAVAAICVGVIGAFGLRAGHRANVAASSADKAAACANLLLGSVANQRLDPQAISLHCDTGVATELIDRGKARDKQVTETNARVTADVCSLLSAIAIPPMSPAVLQFRRDFGC